MEYGLKWRKKCSNVSKHKYFFISNVGCNKRGMNETVNGSQTPPIKKSRALRGRSKKIPINSSPNINHQAINSSVQVSIGSGFWNKTMDVTKLSPFRRKRNFEILLSSSTRPPFVVNRSFSEQFVFLYTILFGTIILMNWKSIRNRISKQIINCTIWRWL